MTLAYILCVMTRGRLQTANLAIVIPKHKLVTVFFSMIEVLLSLLEGDVYKTTANCF